MAVSNHNAFANPYETSVPASGPRGGVIPMTGLGGSMFGSALRTTMDGQAGTAQPAMPLQASYEDYVNRPTQEVKMSREAFEARQQPIGGLAAGLSSLTKPAIDTNPSFGSFSSPSPGYSGFGKGVGGGGGGSMDLGSLSVSFNPSSGGASSFAKGGQVDDFYSRGVQYIDGVPAYGIGGSLRKAWKGTVGAVEDLAKPITEPFTDAIKPILPYVQYVAPFIPGVGTAMAVGLGALGSGFAGGGGFNLKRGIMGGITAYGMSNLASSLSAAGGPPPASIPSPDVSNVASSLGEGLSASTAPGSQAAMLAEQSAGFGDAGLSNIASSASYASPPPLELGIAGGNVPLSQVAQTGLTPPPPGYLDAAKTQFGQQYQGLKNLSGLGETTMGQKEALSAAGKEFGKGSAMGIYAGATGQMALDEYDKLKKEEDAANAIAKAENDSILARIEASKQRGIDAMRSRPYMFAYGGTVDDEVTSDDLGTMQGNMQKGLFAGGVPSYAQGGQPKFLSGGGDGMSDSIPATINGDQPARLADGEFVIPADVVSHLGNGSSKAGAKKLYSMMDKVRTARTGTKKQGKQINPAKFMPA
jgi:hypothetical protein